MRHAVIMAGGAGTRLWPLSRKQRPKQLLRLFDGESLLQVAWRRLSGLFEPQHVYVITCRDYAGLVAKELPELPAENVIAEPHRRDTANAIGLAAHLLKLRDAAAEMAVFTSDHLISPHQAFQDAVRIGLDAAHQHSDALVTFGIKPDQPHTGYGYIQRGAALSRESGLYEVGAFREKPARETAEAYLRSGEYFWNSGMFCWRVDTLLGALAQHLPENHAALAALAQNWAAHSSSDQTAAAYARLPAISIDYAIMEKAARVLMVEMHCAWRDMGTWSAIGATQPPDAAGNALLAQRALAVAGSGNLLVAEDRHLLVTLGVSNLVVVHGGDVTLVCDRAHEQHVRELVRVCVERFGAEYE